MSTASAEPITASDAAWPQQLGDRLGTLAPPTLYIAGPIAILAERRVGLFCSRRTPGDAILPAHDAARRLRDSGETVISGFQSPIEKECLKILLRGSQPIIICPARAIGAIHIDPQRRAAFDAGRILFLSPFATIPRRVNRESSVQRNEVVAAMADTAYVAHFSEEGQTARIVQLLRRWRVPLL